MKKEYYTKLIEYIDSNSHLYQYTNNKKKINAIIGISIFFGLSFIILKHPFILLLSLSSILFLFFNKEDNIKKIDSSTEREIDQILKKLETNDLKLALHLSEKIKKSKKEIKDSAFWLEFIKIWNEMELKEILIADAAINAEQIKKLDDLSIKINNDIKMAEEMRELINSRINSKKNENID